MRCQFGTSFFVIMWEVFLKNHLCGNNMPSKDFLGSIPRKYRPTSSKHRMFASPRAEIHEELFQEIRVLDAAAQMLQQPLLSRLPQCQPIKRKDLDEPVVFQFVLAHGVHRDNALDFHRLITSRAPIWYKLRLACIILFCNRFIKHFLPFTNYSDTI